ncbi:MAG: hypothetical protein CFE32_13650 [Alphaproteobacteria bacterium PA3]|nr:MAG: hypothetical protein CFE32_13650 [Alphaproteobacteria bacterium PA3]
MISRLLALLVLGSTQQSAPQGDTAETKVRVRQAEVPVATGQPSERILTPQISPKAARAVPVPSDPSNTPVQARKPVPQLAKAKDGRAATQQLAPKKASAAPPPPLSQLSQGRDTGAAALKGNDRCNKADEAEAADVCSRVIETRSAEFPIPDREPLSPEQRLLADQNMQDTSPLDANAAARRLATGHEDETSVALAVANLALIKPVVGDHKKESETKDQSPNATDALVAAIIIQATGGMPPN